MRTIGAVTTSRSDYSSLLPVLRLINQDPEMQLLLFVGGSHLAPEFGLTVNDIEADGFEITDRIETLADSDSKESIAKSLGLVVTGFAESLAGRRPDIVLLVGDRLEMLAVACAVLTLNIPLAHISGGDNTEGAIDNQVRHAISKMSHLHFVAMEDHARRLAQMGEETSRVFVTGDPALDLIHNSTLLTVEELSSSLGMKLESPMVVGAFHPTTLGTLGVTEQIDSLLSALERFHGTVILTYPNADPDHRVIVERMQCFADSQPQTGMFNNLSQTHFYSLLAQADLMVGNSSSGIWESPSFCLPVVNIGGRQKGRLRARNVIDVDSEADSIYQGMCRGLEPSFRASLAGMENPYGQGNASPVIVSALKTIEIGPELLQKPFVDLISQRVASGNQN